MNPRRAFTLVEVLLATALVALLTGLVFGALLGVANRRDRLMALAEQLNAGTQLFDHLHRDIMFAIAGRPGHAGIAGSSDTLTIVSRSVVVPPGSDGPRDAVASRYRFDSASGTVRIARAEGWDAPADGEVAATNVRRLRFRYHDGTRWLESFDSLQADALPVAIEVALWFGSTGQPDDADDGARPPDRVRIFAVSDGPTRQWGVPDA